MEARKNKLTKNVQNYITYPAEKKYLNAIHDIILKTEDVAELDNMLKNLNEIRKNYKATFIKEDNDLFADMRKGSLMGGSLGIFGEYLIKGALPTVTSLYCSGLGALAGGGYSLFSQEYEKQHSREHAIYQKLGDFILLVRERLNQLTPIAGQQTSGAPASLRKRH